MLFLYFIFVVMTTTDADVSFMTSYFDGEITKQEMLSNFPVEELPKQDETNHDSYKNFVKNLGKLTWVINKYYNSANDDNKKIIVELINIYLVYYYNYFNTALTKLRLSSGDNETIQAEESRINQIIQSLGTFIVRIHYKLKYYELKNLPSGELYAYVTMEENIQSSSSLKNDYIMNFDALAQETIDSDEILQITRGALNNTINLLKRGSYESAYTLLLSVLETNNHTKKDKQSSVIDETSSLKETDEIILMENEINDTAETDTKSTNDTSETYTKSANDNDDNDDNYDDEVSALIDDYYTHDRVANSTSIEHIMNIDVDLDNDDMDDIGIQIISDEEAEKIIKENLKTVGKMRNETSIEDVQVPDEDIVPEGYLNTTDIIKSHFDNAWETDVEMQLKIISRFIAENADVETNEELKKVKIYETRYTLYILSFLRAEQFV
jgi:hypothetical protein